MTPDAEQSGSPSPDIIVVSPSLSIDPSPIASDTPTPVPTTVPTNPPAPADSSPAPPDSNSTIVTTDPQVAESSAELVSVESQPIEKITLANGQPILDTVNTDWNIDEAAGTATTKESVKLGIKYIFPLDNRVTVTFSSLPADESLR